MQTLDRQKHFVKILIEQNKINNEAQVVSKHATWTQPGSNVFRAWMENVCELKRVKSAISNNKILKHETIHKTFTVNVVFIGF